MDAASVVYQEDGEFSVWQEWCAMFLTMADDRAAKFFGLVGRKDAPQFTCQGDAFRLCDDLGGTARFFRALYSFVFFFVTLNLNGA